MNKLSLLIAVGAMSAFWQTVWGQPVPSTPDLWDLALSQSETHRFSTLFTAHDVRSYLSDDKGVREAIDFCKKTGITKVYLEEFRDGYQAERQTLLNAKKRFDAAGFLVSGCVTTTRVGKPSTEWSSEISCYTDEATQERLQSVFEYAAGLFDEIMIDDFWFTDCACAQCDNARASRTVTIGQKKYAAPSDRWEDFRCELMYRLSTDRVLGPARRVNPHVRLIIKYPQWYDNFPSRGYDVATETEAFDRIWVGTETRDYRDEHWGGTPQYEGYFIMRWLGGVGGGKCGGGWYDWLGTMPQTYIEQARQTVLGGAKETMLFCYGGLHRETGPDDVQALRSTLPRLLATAQRVQFNQPVGVAAYKPINSFPVNEPRVFDFVGMIGLPLVPCHEFPTNAPAAFFSSHAIKDRNLVTELSQFIAARKPVLVTDGLAQLLKDSVDLNSPNVHVLRVGGNPKALLDLSQPELDSLRVPFLQALRVSFEAPNRVSLYLFGDKEWVVENFNDALVRVSVNGQSFSLEARGWRCHWD